MPSRVFVSYRREDAAGEAGRLADYLTSRFGAESVFLDIDKIQPGADFVEVLNTSLQETSVLLVIIGSRWVSLRNAEGVRRLDDARDFVRLEIERALARGIPVIPVLVQSAAMPGTGDLPDSLAPLATRQAITLDHAEFHADAERLCERLASFVTPEAGTRNARRRWLWISAAALAAVLLVFAANRVMQGGSDDPSAPDAVKQGEPRAAEVTAGASDVARQVEELLTTAAAQRRRNQSVEALATLASARQLAPDSAAVRQLQEDVAMEWIRDVRFEIGTSSVGEAIKPALAIVDTALASATGPRRADLLAHSGWATFMLWRDGDRRLNPADWYREAIAVDPQNPYANAMLAHWALFQGDDVPRAAELFQKAVQSGRAIDEVRALQWAGYGNSNTPEANVELVRVADAMRRDNQRLNTRQAQTLYGRYYFALTDRGGARDLLLQALAPDEHIKTLEWAFEMDNADEAAQRRIVAFYVALLHDRGGRRPQAVESLMRLNAELKDSPGTLLDAVKASLAKLRAQ